MKRETRAHRTFVAVAIAVLVAVTSLASSSNVDVQLALDETSVLPATPTAVRITVVNHGEQAVQLPSAVSLVATDGAGKVFTLRVFGMSGALAAAVPESSRTVAAEGTQELRFDPSNAVAGSPWLMDERLWRPGSYRLHAVLAPEVRTDGTFDAATAFVSNEESLRVTTPSGEDAEVWSWMQRQKWSEQSWAMRGRDLAEFIVHRHPRSQYALFIALYLPNADGPAPLLADLVARYPNRSFTDQVRLLQIQAYQQSAYLAYRQHDAYRAANESDRARTIAADLLHNSRSSHVRAVAKELLNRTPKREPALKKPETP